jgi:hypothetical protein
VSASASSLTVTAGQSGQITVTVTPINGSAQTVTLSCSGLPAMTTCQANPASITLDGTHSATSTITIQTTAAAVPAIRVRRDAPFAIGPETMNGFPASSLAQTLKIALALLALLYGVQSMRRRRAGSFVLSAVIVGVLLVVGCGGGGSSVGNSGGGSGGTPAGTYPITLTISAGSSLHTVTASINVTK